MRLRLVTLLCLGAAIFGAPARAVGPQLPDCFTELGGFQGNFRQVLRDEQGALLQSHTGRVESLRPGRLRWEIISPYQELLLSDGQKLLHYQPELQQLREYALADHPLLQLLDGAPEAARSAELHLEALPAAPGEMRYRARLARPPAEAAPEYEIILRNCLPHRIRWRDELGQSVDILLRGVSRKLPSAGRFHFRAPAGTERVPHGG